MTRRVARRRLLTVGAGSLLLSGCDRLAEDDRVRRVLARAEDLTRAAQRLISPSEALAREFTEADITTAFRANGSIEPDNDEYQELAANNFSDWRLKVDGLVERPDGFTMEQLRAMPSRTQITRHDCVEGWSCIGKWTGVKLAALLARVGVQDRARYVVFHCGDTLEGNDPESRYYESIDLTEAVHPQTILAYEMNGQALPVRHGAPLRLRVERQLGYKMAKYVMRIEVVDSFARIAGGKGGSWEDLGYAWYAGI